MPRHVHLDKRITRAAFKSAVMGKDKAGVIAAVGRPYTRQTYGESEYWFYEELTVEQVPGATDFHTQVHFRNGIAIDVTF
jgi:outer membrane protein assembly factor BamE (lipoprotein component of BamABCDE complex)